MGTYQTIIEIQMIEMMDQLRQQLQPQPLNRTEIVLAAIHPQTEGIRFISQQVVFDIQEMIFTTIKPWIAELLCMVIIEAQLSVHLRQKHLYRKDLYPLSHQYLLSRGMPNHLLTQTHHYCHLRFIHLQDGIRISLRDHWTHHLEVVLIMIDQEIKATNQIVQ